MGDKSHIWYLLGVAAFAGLAFLNWQWVQGEKAEPPFAKQSSHFHGPHGAEEHVEEGLLPHGPHGGLLFEDRDLALELVLHEHHGNRWLYAYPFTDAKRPLAPAGIQVTMTFSNAGFSEAVRLTPDTSEGLALAGALPEDVLKGWQLIMLAQHDQHAHEWQIRDFTQPR